MAAGRRRRGLSRRSGRLRGRWRAAVVSAYGAAAAVLAVLAARGRYEHYRLDLRAGGSELDRSFVLHVAREAALMRAVEALALACLVFAALAGAVKLWAAARRRRGASPEQEKGEL